MISSRRAATRFVSLIAIFVFGAPEAFALEPARPTLHLDEGSESVTGIGYDEAGLPYAVGAIYAPGGRANEIKYPRIVAPNHTLAWHDAGAIVLWITHPDVVGETHTYFQAYARETFSLNHGGYILFSNSARLAEAQTGGLMNSGPIPERTTIAAVPTSSSSSWVPDVQRQVAMIWSPNRGLRVLVDGGVDPALRDAFRDLRLAGLPDRLDASLFVGDGAASSGKPHIDRVDLYDHAISDEMVRELSMCPTGICPASSDPRAVLGYAIHASSNTITARVEIDDLAHSDAVEFWLTQSGLQIGAVQALGQRRWMV